MARTANHGAFDANAPVFAEHATEPLVRRGCAFHRDAGSRALFRPVACGGRFAVGFRPAIRAALGSLVLAVAGCASTNATGPAAAAVLLEAPGETCEPLGAMAVRMSSELLLSEDARHASAVSELRQRAAVRGATHLVVARPATAASVAYGTTAAASGLAYRCPEQR